MEKLKQLLSEQHPLVSFDDSEIDKLIDITQHITIQEGQDLFFETDPGDSVYLLAEGAVDLFTCPKENIEQTLMTVKAGGFVGISAVVDQGARGVNARAAEATVAYKFDRNALNSLITDEGALSVKLLLLFSDLLGKRLRIAIDSLRQNLAWTLQVSGLASLDISQLIVDRVNIIIELVNGKQLSGLIMKAEEHPSGFELFLKTEDGRMHFIPYRAIVSASMPGDAIKETTNQLPSY